MSNQVKATLSLIGLGLVAAINGADAGDVKVEGKFISTIPDGTPPLEVSSTTNVANLNSDTVDGFHGNDFYTISELATSGMASVHFDNITDLPSDGVIEINQECATTGGCFSGDTGGFPVTIETPGSYRLTSNLENSNENFDLLEVRSDDVSIDLNGFALIGANSCSGAAGAPVTGCDFSTGGDGVDFVSTGFGVKEMGSVSNGLIRGMPRNGIRADRSIVIRHVRVTESGSTAITFLNGGGIVRDSVVFRNGGTGIFAAARVVGNVVQNNADDGIFVNNGGLIRDNQIFGNGATGMRCAGCLALDNMIYDNLTGLDLDGGASYGRNLIFDNGANLDISGTNHEVAPNSCGTPGSSSAC